MPLLHGIRDAVVEDQCSRRDDKWYKELRPETAATPGKQKDPE
jgi:hypothetical protein